MFYITWPNLTEHKVKALAPRFGMPVKRLGNAISTVQFLLKTPGHGICRYEVTHDPAKDSRNFPLLINARREELNRARLILKEAVASGNNTCIDQASKDLVKARKSLLEIYREAVQSCEKAERAKVAEAVTVPNPKSSFWNKILQYIAYPLS